MNNKGVFVGAHLTSQSVRDLRFLATIIGCDPKQVNVKDTHITIGFSKIPLKIAYKPLKNLDIKVTPTRLAYIGQYVALLVESQWLRDQWNSIRALGGTWDFSGYIPHVSICKNPPSDLPLTLGNMYLKYLDLRVKSTYTEKLRD